MYLQYTDYSPFIQDANFQQIITSDDFNRTLCEQLAQAEAISYLRNKYDTTLEFTDTPAYDATVSYLACGRAVLSGTIYYLSLPHNLFSLTGNYAKGDIVFWKNKVYQAQIASVPVSHYDALQIGNIENIPFPNVFPDDINCGLKYWGVGTAYSVTGLSPTLAASAAYNNSHAYSIGDRVTYNSIRYKCLIAGTGNVPNADITHWQPETWVEGDNRDQQIVKILIDIVLYHLHSRLSSRVVPELRTRNYSGREEDKTALNGILRYPSYSALGQLQAFASGDLSPELPLLQPRSSRILYGGEVKKINTY